MPAESLCSIRHLTVEYQTRAGAVKAVDEITFDIRRG
jgi:ABC-type dipeptide/oligopeptide/nickel transport system ATPase component